MSRTPSPPVVPPRGVVRRSDSPGHHQGHYLQNRLSSGDSIPYADISLIDVDDGRQSSKDSNSSTNAVHITHPDISLHGGVDGQTGMQQLYSMCQGQNDTTLNMTCETKTAAGEESAQFIPHNCMGGCEPVIKGPFKTGWL